MSATKLVITLSFVSFISVGLNFTPDHLFVPLGRFVVLDCVVESQSKSYWKKEEDILYIDRIPTYHRFADSISLARNYSIIVNSVRSAHEGSYSCFTGNITIATYTLGIEGLYLNR